MRPTRLLPRAKRWSVFAALAAFASAASAVPAATAAAPDPAGVEFFERKIRPVLAEHCYACHSADAQAKKKLKADLFLDTAAGWRRGGENGPALVPGKPSDSLLLKALRGHGDQEQMPPDKPLPGAVVADFERWVAIGAPDPRDGAAPAVAAAKVDVEAGRSFWAFQPPRKPQIPAVKDGVWPRADVDRFTLAAMEANGVRPVADADPVTLLRRLHFDLTGLPPTPADVDRFLRVAAVDRAKAVEAEVDRLLASPAFGERWGRHWLDVARFAESRGSPKGNVLWPDAWRYRDWVIDAVNADLPYDQFLRLQVAGDLLPADTPEARERNRVATGFLAVGSKAGEPFDQLEEQVGTLGVATMAVTLACARCHDHKFDPVPTADYYAVAGIFYNTQVVEGSAKGGKKAQAGGPKPAKLATGTTPMVAAADAVKSGRPTNKPGSPTQSGNLRVQVGGSADHLGDAVPRGLVRVLTPPGFDAKIAPDESGRRQLAEWLASPDHPLTARVMANRVWHHLFGRGIVATVDNFGALGERPSHPELLDHLAVTFMDDGWSLKRLVRRVVLSRTYQLSAATDPANERADPDNALAWHHRVRRLDAEALRDALLAAGGALDRTPPGGALIVGVTSGARETHDVPHSPHRSVYLPVVRGAPVEVLEAFDFPDPSLPAGRRDTATVPTQALLFMNHPLVMDQAARLAESLLAGGADDRARLDLAYLRSLGRRPAADEVQRDLVFLSSFASAGPAAGSAPAPPPTAADELADRSGKKPKGRKPAEAGKAKGKAKSEGTATAGPLPAPVAPAAPATPAAAPDAARLRAWTTHCHALFASAEFRFLR